MGGYYSNYYGEYRGYTENCVIDKNIISFCSDEAIIGVGTNNVTISNNIIKNISKSGIYIYGSEDTVISANHISSTYHSGIFINTSIHTQITNNEISYSNQYGVEIERSKKYGFKGNSFIGNKLGDIHYYRMFGAFYINNSLGEILVAWIGSFYILFFFYVIHKNYEKKNRSRGTNPHPE